MIPEQYTPELTEEYTRRGYWKPVTFSHFWDRNASLYPDKEAIVDSKTRLTWAEAKRAIDRIALGLVELGIERDEVVMMQMPMSVEYLLLRTALEKAGILNLPIMRSYRHQEVKEFAQMVDMVAVFIPWKLRGFDHFQMIEELRPNLGSLRHIIVAGEEVPPGAISLKKMMETPLEEKYPPELLETRRLKYNELFYIHITTGSTGAPKLLEQALCHRVYQSQVWVEVAKFTVDDVTAVISPAVAGPNNPGFFQAPMVGAKIAMLELWEPEAALRLIEKERVTVFGATSAQVGMMLNVPNFDKYDVSSVRFIVTTGSALSYGVAREAERKFGCPIVNTLGAAEIGGNATFSPLDAPFEQRVLTVGKPKPGNEVRLVDEESREVPEGEVGEICFRGPTIAPGFYRDPKRNQELFLDGGWVRTGDQGKWDKDGNLVIVGRIKDLIIRAGQNIFPGETEGILYTHPKISSVAVVAMPDPLMGERVCAYVVPKTGERLTLDEMSAFLKSKGLASFKLPERLELVTELPFVAGGGAMLKVDKKALQADITEKLKKEGKISDI